MKRVIVTLSIVVMLCCSAVCLSSCGTDDIDISSYANEEIVLSGIQDEDIVITISDLKALPCTTIKTNSTSDKIGVVRATGPELGTVLGEYGCAKKDFRKVKIYGSDEYDVSLNNDYITEHDIYLAFGIDGEPLDEESAPCRIIIPKSDSSYWTRMVNRIEFVK